MSRKLCVLRSCQKRKLGDFEMETIKTSIGLDGCKRGWIGVYRNIHTQQLETHIFERIELVNPSQFNCIAIDIPIGLPDLGSRDCDIEARRILRSRRSCVFPAPIRPVMVAKTYEAACEIRFRLDGKKISKQTFNIMPKILEVDNLLQNNRALRKCIFEVHPEVSFCIMNGGIPLQHKKKRSAGKHERIRLVDGCFGARSFTRLANSLDAHDGWADDDLLDACAALWTAEKIVKGASKSLPEESINPDSTGLPMRIVF